jgi:hypothetical protein
MYTEVNTTKIPIKEQITAQVKATKKDELIEEIM